MVLGKIMCAVITVCEDYQNRTAEEGQVQWIETFYTRYGHFMYKK